MAFKGQWKQKTGATTFEVMHPETEADVVLYSGATSGLSATNVQDAIDAIVLQGTGVTGIKYFGETESTEPHVGVIQLNPTVVGAVAASEKGVASGVATLDENAKIPTSQLPDVIVGQMVYGGTVSSAGVATLTENAKDKLGVTSATINLPTTPTTVYEGIYFIADNTCTGVTVVGVADVRVGDWLVAVGGAWKKIDNTDAVSSVNGLTGAVVLTATNVEYATGTSIKSKIDTVDAKIKVTSETVDASGVTGNAVTGATISNGQLHLTGTTTFATADELTSGLATKADAVAMTAGTYSAVTVNTQGIVTAGSQVLAVIENGGSTAGIATNGWYFEKAAEPYEYTQSGSVVTLANAPYSQSGSVVTIL